MPKLGPEVPHKKWEKWVDRVKRRPRGHGYLRFRDGTQTRDIEMFDLHRWGRTGSDSDIVQYMITHREAT